MNKKVGIWLRVSTEDQAKGESPQHHEKRARMYAELKKWDVIEVYNLAGWSGKTVMEHPETKRMLKDIESGRISGLIFSKIARLARNTRELLDFADIFLKHKADLVSLQEAIDTSTPAGRLFYTIVAAMAQWEREEIAERVKVSVPIRAKMGKSLGGEAPFGYTWVNKKLEINEDEAPVRKLMFELFADLKRIRTVAETLNEKGYRTRRGGKWSANSVRRLIEAPIAKGTRRVNYTQSRGDGKSWDLKPEDEWVFQEAPPIVSESLWDRCKNILKEISNKHTRKRRKAVHLFSGVTWCECKTKMYMRNNSPAYYCKNCKNKILPEDLEHIFQEQLRNFLFSDEEIKKHLNEERSKIKEQETLLTQHQKRIAELNEEIKKLLNLFYKGKVLEDAFESYHEPLYQELKQREEAMLEVQSTIDGLSMQTLSNDQLVQDARDLQSYWSKFEHDDKRKIIEAITESIIIGKEDIEINLKYIPVLSAIEPEKPKKKQSSSGNLFCLPIPLPKKLLKLLDKPSWIHRRNQHKTTWVVYGKFRP